VITVRADLDNLCEESLFSPEDIRKQYGLEGDIKGDIKGAAEES
jgi:hypothetical protein